MTWGSGKAVQMTEEEFRLLRDLICDYCGVYFEDSFLYLLERRLQPRLPVYNLSTFRDYYRLIKYSATSEREFDEIVERVTTNETYFFREAYQLKAFTDEILPIVVQGRAGSNGNDRIRIWSAGCSTGEEPYSIAMLLDESPIARGHAADIFGNDISRKVLRTARSASYREPSFRSVEPRYIERYFIREDHGFRLRPEIARQVSFGHLNLMDEGAMAVINNVDVVFCRNVMIYFHPAARMRLLQAFYRKLRPGGFLLLGHAESLINVSTDFELAALKNDIVYRKPLGSRS